MIYLSDLLFTAAAQRDGGLVHGSTNPRDALTERQSFAMLRAEAERILGGLQAAGAHPGDFVMLPLSRSKDLLPALWACLIGGFVAAPRPVSPRFARDGTTADERSLLASVGPYWTVHIGGSPEEGDPRSLALDELRQAPSGKRRRHRSSNEIAIALTTSGTTNHPRWVVLSHRNILASLRGSVDENCLDRSEVSLNWLPLHHIGGLMRSLREVYLGCLQLQIPNEVIAGNPLYWLDLIDRYRVTITWAPNFGWNLLLTALREASGEERPSWDLGSLRSFHSSGEAVRGRTVLDLWSELEPHGLRRDALHTAWGMTEVCFATCSRQLVTDLLENPDREPSSGGPIAGVSLRIVDGQGRLQEDGEVGHLEVSGPAVGRYLEDKVRLEDKVPLDDDVPLEDEVPPRWLATGDLGSLNEGHLRLHGRARDLLVVHGRKHSPTELESTVETVAGVAPGTAVVSSIGAKGREAILFFTPEKPFERPHRSAAVARLAQRCRSRVAERHGITLRWVVPIDAESIPRSSLGKVRRQTLTEQWANGEPTGPRGWPFDLHAEIPRARAAIHEGRSTTGRAAEVATVFATVLGRERIDVSANFFALGGDSLRALRAFAALEERYRDRDLSIADLYRWPTAEAFARHLDGEPSRSGAPERPTHETRHRRRKRRVAALTQRKK